MQPAGYCGRFAPSPTGPLHIGSLIAAVGSYLEARTHDGVWRLRMEDLDPPREMPGAADQILRTLETYGFEWDGDVVYQSQRTSWYEDALAQLRQRGLLYPCGCTRKEIGDSAIQGIEGPVYPGTCRHGLAEGKSPRAWRIRVDDCAISFDDALQGRISQHLSQDIGDFVLKRADGYYAYQLAVVVADADELSREDEEALVIALPEIRVHSGSSLFTFRFFCFGKMKGASPKSVLTNKVPSLSKLAGYRPILERGLRFDSRKIVDTCHQFPYLS